jgi:phospholipid transport system substrate-binding protein
VKIMKSFIITTVMVLVASIAGTAGAERPSGPSDAIRSANARVRELLAANADPGSDAARKAASKITHELRDLFDIGDLAKRALVDHWGTMTQAQRTALVDTLRAIVEKNYIAQLRSNLNYEIVYTGEEPQGGDMLVRTVIKAERGGRPVEIPVDYLLHPEAGGWRAYDVVTDEVSILKNYRSQFNRIIAKDGVDGLIRRMKAKLDKNED